MTSNAKQIQDYLEKFPYQETYEYAEKYTDRLPRMLNEWSLGEVPTLVEAGEDEVVRMNNDTVPVVR